MNILHIQGVIEIRDQILNTRYSLHAELGKNILKMSKIKMTFISAHFKNTPCLSYFIKRTPMRCSCFKACFLEDTSHWRTFYKI
jgi:hypothetical protein